LDIYDAVKGACQTSDFHTHMLFLTRNAMGQVEGERLTPKVDQIFDGFDELRPQTRYISDWAGHPTRDDILSALGGVTAGSQHQDLVRSLTCFRAAYFQRAGRVVVQFSDDWTHDQFQFASSENFEPSTLQAGEEWHKQDTLGGALIALCKFAAAKHRARFNGGGVRVLYLMTVGSHTVPPRRMDSALLQPSQAPLLSVIQSVWVVLSVPVASASEALLRRLAVTLPAIEDAMKSSLILNLLHQQEALQEEANAEVAAYDALKSEIRNAGRSYQLFQESIDKIIRVTQTPSEVLRRFANVLRKTLLASKNQEYESPVAKSTNGKPVMRCGIHAVDTNPSLYTKGYEEDLAHYLKEAIESEHARTRFLGAAEVPPDVRHLLWLKSFVYRLFADGEHSRLEMVRFGMLRAATRWRVSQMGVHFKGDVCRGTLDLDRRALLAAKDPTTQQPLFQDIREFVAGLAAAIDAWLGPWADEDDSKPDTEFRELQDRCEVTLIGGRAEGQPDRKKVLEMLHRLKTAWQTKEPMSGDFGPTLLQLARAKSPQLPEFEYSEDATFAGARAKVLTLCWVEVKPRRRLNRVSFACADVGDRVPTRYVRLEFPTA
jgi:hypothetical protein